MTSPQSLSLTIHGFGTAPRLGKRPVKTQVVPVRLIGSFYHGAPGVSLAPLVEHMTVRGIAVITWSRYEDDIWFISHLTYNIARN